MHDPPIEKYVSKAFSTDIRKKPGTGIFAASAASTTYSSVLRERPGSGAAPR